MTPIGWTPEGTATWQRANLALRAYIAEASTRRCPWCHGARGFYQKTELGSFLFVRCDGCFGTGEWKQASAEH